MQRVLPTRWGLSILEGLILFALLVVLCYAIQQLWPASGFAQAIHAGFHVIAIALQWVAGGLNALAGILNQL